MAFETPVLGSSEYGCALGGLSNVVEWDDALHGRVRVLSSGPPLIQEFSIDQRELDAGAGYVHAVVRLRVEAACLAIMERLEKAWRESQ